MCAALIEPRAALRPQDAPTHGSAHPCALRVPCQSLLGCQPLLVLRPTGPITAITIKLSTIADTLHLDFNQYLAATGVCIGLLMAVCACLELSRHIRRITPFTHEIFAIFVRSLYL